MCGIVVMHQRNGPIDERRLETAVQQIAHRGPDRSGIWISSDRTLGLGHRRLSVIDVSDAGRQPMHSEPGRTTITFNGEIYNYRELRAELVAMGYAFQGGTDTEVILKAYAAWGHACLERLNGMFAFVLHDEARNQLFIARDRAGEKPLFYRHSANGLVAGSELKALLDLVVSERKVNIAALQEYLTWGYVGADRCLLEGYKKLPPAHYAIYDLASGQLKVERYWSPPARSASSGSVSLDELSEELEQLLESAVGGQLVADVPLGVFLSGGLDSSVVTAMACKASRNVRTFTVTFPGAPRLDEASFARRIASHFGTQHTEIPVGDIDSSFVDALAVQVDEPIGDTSLLPTAALARATRSHVTVAVGGDGADELFGGYPQYARLATIDPWRRRLPAGVRQSLGGQAARQALSLPGHNTVCSLFDEPGSIGKFNIYFNLYVRNCLLPAFANLKGADVEAQREALVPRGLPAGERASRADFTSYLPDEVLVKVDRASMLFALEVRAPFLDHRIIEFALGKVPWSLKVSGGSSKILLRHLAMRLLPDDLDMQRKQGFTPPIGAWLNGTLNRDMEATFKHLGSIGFDTATLRLLARNPARNGNRLFLLIMLSKWMQHYRVTL